MNTSQPQDCNEEIIALIRQRLDMGRKHYGHGLILRDDAEKHGVKVYDWVQESIEEALDLAVYLTAKLLEVQKKTKEVAC